MIDFSHAVSTQDLRGVIVLYIDSIKLDQVYPIQRDQFLSIAIWTSENIYNLAKYLNVPAGWRGCRLMTSKLPSLHLCFVKIVYILC